MLSFGQCDQKCRITLIGFHCTIVGIYCEQDYCYELFIVIVEVQFTKEVE